MKTSLQLRLGQQLTMTPQLQQAIRLLQLSTLELQTEIQTALESNPMLELQEEQERDESTRSEPLETLHEEFEPTWQSLTGNGSGGSHHNLDEDSDLYQKLHAQHESLQDHLLWQVNMSSLSPNDKLIAHTIIDAIDDAGYLSMPLTDLLQTLQPQIDIELDEMNAVLHWIQNGDPLAVGAQDLQECLLIQAKHLPNNTPWRCEVISLLQDYFELLTTRSHGPLMRKLKLDTTSLQEVVSTIQSLNPRPGSQITTSQPKYIYPDVLVKKIRGEWLVELNPDTIPKVSINSTYAAMVKRADSSSDNTYLKGQLQEARWLLKSLESRNDTLLKVARCIVSYQENFLEYGEEAMKPLVLHYVAEAIDMHESTISRVTTQKYMHTPRGIFELKYFFSSHVNTKAGGECSSTAIRALIKKLIAEENSQKPLSDNKIALLLQEQGIKVARRTIAKYRESLHIPSSSERKRL